MVIPEGMEPLAVFDPREWPCRYGDGEVQQITWWMAKHLAGLNAWYADRVEIYVLDGPFAVVHRYKRGDDGRRVAPLAEEPPVIVPLAELPPAHLLRTP
jgi:hypothetical protein